jgi:hypothetical protein
MATKTTFVCDCCHREADTDFGWASVSIQGRSETNQLLPDEHHDLCEICWSPLKTLMNKVSAEARERSNPPADH